MAQRAKPWFRLYSEVLNDQKLRRIARNEQLPYAMVLGVWTTVLCLANESPERGKLMIAPGIEVSEEDISDMTGIEVGTIGHLLCAFQQMGMITDEWDAISHWDDRQFESDSSTERVQRFRDKRCNADETFQKRSCDVIDTDTDTDTDTEKERDARKPEFPPMDDLAEPPQKAATPPEPTARRQKAKPPKEPPPPAVQVYFAVMGKYPPKPLWTRIEADVGGKRELWSKVIHGWLGMGWNGGNVNGMLDFLKRGEIPGEKTGKAPDTSDLRPVPAGLGEQSPWGND